MGERSCQLLEFRTRQADCGDGLDVDVAAQRIEVTQRARADDPRAGEAAPEIALEATRQLGEVGLYGMNSGPLSTYCSR